MTAIGQVSWVLTNKTATFRAGISIEDFARIDCGFVIAESAGHCFSAKISEFSFFKKAMIPSSPNR